MATLTDRLHPHESWVMSLDAEPDGTVMLWVGDNVAVTFSVTDRVLDIELPDRATPVGHEQYRLALYEEETDALH